MSKKKVSPETEAEEEAVAVTAEEAEVDMDRLLEDARAKADEHWDKLLRLQAEMENSQRRAQRELENAHKYGLEKFAQELLPVKDSLELGLAAVDENEHEAFLKLREGTELTLKMLSAALEKFGIKEVDPLGQPFSAEQHQAMAMQESAEHAANTVMAVMQKGYLINDRLLRPAMVIVSKGPAAEAVDEQA
jgi:molecular chaperone GrpE